MGSLKVAKHAVVQVKQTYLWLVEACEPPTYKPGMVVKDEW